IECRLEQLTPDGLLPGLVEQAALAQVRVEAVDRGEGVPEVALGPLPLADGLGPLLLLLLVFTLQLPGERRQHEGRRAAARPRGPAGGPAAPPLPRPPARPAARGPPGLAGRPPLRAGARPLPRAVAAAAVLLQGLQHDRVQIAAPLSDRPGRSPRRGGLQP